MSIFATLVDVADMLDRAGVEYIIGGSLASSVWGEERATRDVDIAAIFTVDQIDALEAQCEWPYIIDAESMRAQLQLREDFASGQILNGDTQDKFDLFILRRDDYALAQIERRYMIELFPGRKFPVASAEDIVITKLRWYILGNQVSDKQWNDIVQVLEVQYNMLDEQYMEKWAQHFGILELLREAQSQVVV